MDIYQEFANTIFNTLGPGYSERVYHNAMEVLLRKHNIPYETECIVPIIFMGHTVGNVRADIIVDKKLILEFKSVKNMNPMMEQQARQYMKLTGIQQALLINFPQSQTADCECVVVGCKSMETTLEMS